MGIKDNAGFTVTEFLVSTAIIVIVIAAIGTLMSTISKQSKQTSLVLTRDTLQMELIRTIRSEPALTRTRAEERRFASCFARAPSPGPPCVGSIVYGIDLYDAQGQIVAGSASDTTGRPASPVYYDLSGARCGRVASPDCPIAVTTSFRAQGFPVSCPTCLGTVPATTQPNGYTQEVIEIRYQIDITPGAGQTTVSSSAGSVVLDLTERNP